MMNRFTIIVAALTASMAFSQLVVAQSDDSAEAEYFEKHVRPVLIEHCYSCHSAKMEISGGLLLDSRVGLRKGGDSGPALVPGQPEKSLIIEAIRYGNADLQMPPKQKLPESAIKSLVEWVKRGAFDPRDEPMGHTGHQPTGMSIEDGREFWSFKPVQEPSIPNIQNTAWVQTPIDHFVLSRLEENQLQPAEVADKRTLVRRVTYNLTGLPPAPDEVQEFLQDDSPDAYERLVDRLLASPHYGVHWGRHWLDVSRYADSNGLDENLAYGQAWRYRDYVVNSFNNGKPYNRFVVEQLAGDLLPAANNETRTATGFLALGAKVLAEPDRQKLDMDIIDEQIDTTGKVFLGLTLGCVRCHDHKFDPIKQADYYALAAIFKSTKSLAETRTGVIKHWYEHSFWTDADRIRIADVEKEIQKRKRAASSFKSEAMQKLRTDARNNAAKYLAFAAQITPEMTLTEIDNIASPNGLHPRILHHCRLHLDYHQNDPFFKTWHELAETNTVEQIRDYYAKLFAAANTKASETQNNESGSARFTMQELELAKAVLNDRSGFLAVPAKEEHAFDVGTLKQYYDLMQTAREFESKAADIPSAMGVGEGTVVKAMPIHIRGSYRNLGKTVSREFPAVFRQAGARPIFPSHQSGRLQLAEWVASSRNPLTARVIVNRVWGWHFGQPLVRTTENFGVLGERPSHPKLLDWLTIRFIKDGWSIKSLNRLILNSSVYQMSFAHPHFEQYSLKDPENRLLWRANLNRLQAESIRDSILAVSKTLDNSLHGKTVPLRNRQFVFNHTSEDHTKYDSTRRAMYLPIIRNHLYPFFEQFDFPDPTMPTGSRNTTTVAPQALILMNSDFVIHAAETFAANLASGNASNEHRIHAAYQRALGREPTSTEMEMSLKFLGESQISRSEKSLQRWTLFCQSLFASNEFIYVR